MVEHEQERINFEVALELQRQLNEREENRPYSVAEVRKNMDKEKGSKKKAGGSRKKTLAKKRAGEKQSDQSARRQNMI
ncbi:hypothetical protein Tco_0254631 [Tanacetum coccineum]